MKAAIYTRVSTTKQADAERSIPDQQAACERFAAEKGWTVTHRFSDAGISAYGGKTRPGFDDARRAAKVGDFDVLVVDSYDRLSRGSDRDSVLGICWELAPADVESVSEPSPVDPNMKSMMRLMYGITANQESERKRGRGKRGAPTRMAAGLPPGRLPLGYALADGRMVVDEDRAGVVRRIFLEWNSGTSQQAIARGLALIGR